MSEQLAFALNEQLRRLWDYVSMPRPKRADRERAELALGYVTQYVDDLLRMVKAHD